MDVEKVERVNHNVVVKYENAFNDVYLLGFTKLEKNVLYTCLANLKNTNSDLMVMDRKQFVEMSKLRSKTMDELEHIILNCSNKLTDLKIEMKTTEKVGYYNIFNYIVFDKENDKIELKLNKETIYLFNDFEQFTKFRLSVITSLKSKYSQALYQKLCQFKNTGTFICDTESLRNLLDVPKSYKMPDLNKLLVRIAEELEYLFEEPLIIQRKTRGRKTLGYVFLFKFKIEEEKQEIPMYNYLTGETLDTKTEYKNLKIKQNKQGL